MFRKKIAASGGYVLLFPERLGTDKSDPFITGPEKARPGLGEEWIQIQLKDVDIEIRKEGDKAATLENSLRCSVIASAKIGMDESRFGEVLPKVISRFHCSPTTDIRTRLDMGFFEPKLATKVELVAEKIIRSASYEKLLDDASHIEALKAAFEQELHKEIEDCGFRVLLCKIEFVVKRPDDGALGPEKLRVLEKWRIWDMAKRRFDAQFKEEDDDLADDAEVKAIKRKERLDILHLEARERERQNNLEFEARMHEFDIRKVKAENEKDRSIADLSKAAEDYRKKIGEAKRLYEHNQDLKAKEFEQELQRKDLEFANEILKSKAAVEAEARQRQLEALQAETALLEGNAGKIKKEQEIARIKAEMDAFATEKRIKAEQTMQTASAEAQLNSLKMLLEKLPEILNSLPKESAGDVTTINLGGDRGGHDASHWQMMGLTLVQPLRRLLDGIAGKMTDDGPASSGPPAKGESSKTS